MNGITINELYEWISNSHEAEFIYKNKTYILQPEVNNKKEYLVIWDCSFNNSKCIAKHKINSNNKNGNIPKHSIDSILSKKCFNGKSFMEIEKDITVTSIY